MGKEKINLFGSAVKTGWLAGQMGRETCFYCVLNAENTVINQSFCRLTGTQHPNETGLKVTSGGAVAPEAAVAGSGKVLILQTRNGFFNSAAISFPLPTRPITANAPGDDAFCVPAAFVDQSQHLNLSEGTLTTFLCRLLEIYL